jgi:hypothetical protein
MGRRVLSIRQIDFSFGCEEVSQPPPCERVDGLIA